MSIVPCRFGIIQLCKIEVRHMLFKEISSSFAVPMFSGRRMEFLILLNSYCYGKRKSTMSPLRKQGSRAKNWIPASAGMTNTVSATDNLI